MGVGIAVQAVKYDPHMAQCKSVPTVGPCPILAQHLPWSCMLSARQTWTGP